MSSKRAEWNRRYAARELVWGAEPNAFVAEILAARAPAGRALDLGCGEGRNALWLAERGWEATGVDYSSVAIERARKLATGRSATARFLEDDVTTWEPEESRYALVLIVYLQIPEQEMWRVLASAKRAIEPGGSLVMIGHAKRNLTEGVGGPDDEAVLWEPDAIAAELRKLGFTVDRAEHVSREVENEARSAIDAILEAHA